MLMKNKKTIYALLGTVTLFAVSMAIFITSLLPAEAKYTGVTRDFYLFSVVNEDIDEDELGIPPDQFSQTQIIVRKHDTVRIHFYNLEPVETQEVHLLVGNMIW